MCLLIKFLKINIECLGMLGAGLARESCRGSMNDLCLRYATLCRTNINWQQHWTYNQDLTYIRCPSIAEIPFFSAFSKTQSMLAANSRHFSRRLCYGKYCCRFYPVFGQTASNEVFLKVWWKLIVMDDGVTFLCRWFNTEINVERFPNVSLELYL